MPKLQAINNRFEWFQYFANEINYYINIESFDSTAN